MAYQIKHRRVALTFDDGSMRMMSFITSGRGNILPPRARWINPAMGTWERDFTELNILSELDRSKFASETVVEMDGTPKRINVVKYRLFAEGDEGITDPAFRGARVDTGTGIGYDMAKAKEIARQNIRFERLQVFAELDAEWMKAVGTKDDKLAAEIEAKRQAWRDAPSDARIDAATTIEELKALREQVKPKEAPKFTKPLKP